LESSVSAEEARARWSALAAFYRSHAHFLVTNGPYRLKSWSPDGVTLEAFRDLSYPLGVGSYDVYAVPRRGFITQSERRGDTVALSGEIEILERFQRSYRLVRTPLEALQAVVVTRAAPHLSYILVDASGRVVDAGSKPLGASRKFELTLPRGLPPGLYTLSALIAVNGNAMDPVIARIPVSLPAPAVQP